MSLNLNGWLLRKWKLSLCLNDLRPIDEIFVNINWFWDKKLEHKIYMIKWMIIVSDWNKLVM